MTQRRRLDAFLAERAADAGAEFRDGAHVDSVSGDGSLTVDGRRIRAGVLVGADGVNGTTARSVGLAANTSTRSRSRATSRSRRSSEDRFRGRVLVELGTVPGGYAWVFPKGDHVNVGVGGWLREGPRLRSHLARVCREYGIPAERLEGTRGYRLPMRRAGASPARGRTLLVGDAAGLVDPLSGDGMFEAFVSRGSRPRPYSRTTRAPTLRSRTCARPARGSVLGRQARAGALSPPDLRDRALSVHLACDRVATALAGRQQGGAERPRRPDPPRRRRTRTRRRRPRTPVPPGSHADALRNRQAPADGTLHRLGRLPATPRRTWSNGSQGGAAKPRANPGR